MTDTHSPNHNHNNNKVDVERGEASRPGILPRASLSGSLLTNGESGSPNGREKRGGLQLDFDPVFSSLKAREKSINLVWENVEYVIGKKGILFGVSGESAPGSVTAIMGPSGAGKTTLLNILAGRITGGKRGRKLSGVLLANGESVTPMHFRKHVAYVTQEDALFPTSTAREAFEFSARLRLPKTVSAEDRKALVNDMIESLGLVKVQNTMIGSELIRGLSGGERKRVAIGVELVSSPSVLFLDEPTSGLDSYSAWKVLRILKAIAALKTTILCSIHQPSSEVFNEFTDLIFLGAGHVIYQGAIQDVDVPFRERGLGVPPRTNVADHVMLLIQTYPLEDLPRDDKNERRYVGRVKPDHLLGENGKRKSVPGFGNQGSFAERTMRMVGSSFSTKEDNFKKEASAGISVQSWYLCVREFKGLIRDKAGLMGRFGGAAFLNLLFAVIFLGVGNQSNSSYTTQSHFGALVQVFIGAMFGSAQPAILTFPLERVVFLRERSTNTYGTIPYFIAKLLVEIPISFLTALVTLLFSYFLIGFGGNFIYLALAVLLLMLASVSTAFVIGSAASNARAALELAPIVLVPQLLFLGLFVSINQIPVFLRWCQYLCAAKYALNLALLTEFDPARAYPNNTQAWINLLAFNDVELSLAWLYVLILLAIFAGFRIISMVILSRRAANFES